MAMTELQRPTKSVFYTDIRNQMSSLNRQMIRCDELCEYLDLMDGNTLDDMGVPAAGADNGLRADLVSLRTKLIDFVSYYNTNLETTINKLRNTV